MNPEKVGEFIKKLRKKNNLTQQQLGDKYGVTYQAVSKWENGINLPEVSLIRQMSKDFNISVEDILDGEEKSTKKSYYIYIIVTVVVLVIILIFLLFKIPTSDTFNFKTISTTCNEFEVTGSIAYDKNKSSIYISHINYCGGNDTKEYENIECNLYEKNGDTNKMISSCKVGSNETLESYLKSIELNIDNYAQTCNTYTNDSLYLEINATKDNRTITYKVPLELNDNCQK